MFIILLVVTACGKTASVEHKLIEWGWDTPRLQNFASVLPPPQNFPFGGAVIDAQTLLDGRGLSWTLFSNTPTDPTVLDSLAKDYGKLSWGRMTDNFLRLTVYPADVDWFDDWTTINANAEAWANLAQKLGFKGIMLDTEQYEKAHLFDYRALTSGRSFDVYAKQAVERGRTFMDALETGFPNLTVMMTCALTVDTKSAQSGATFRLRRRESTGASVWRERSLMKLRRSIPSVLTASAKRPSICSATSISHSTG